MQGYRPIRFGAWVSWQDRNSQSDKNLPGIYVIGHFENQTPPNGAADPLDPNIIYIGEGRRKLSSRWNAFDKATFGRTNETRREAPNITDPSRLFVAFMTSSPLQWLDWDEDSLAKKQNITVEEVRRLLRQYETTAGAKEKGALNGAWIKFVERKLILDFLLKWDKLPDCNKE